MRHSRIALVVVLLAACSGSVVNDAHTTPTSKPHASTTDTGAGVTSVADNAPPSNGLRFLFSHTSSDALTVVARTGMVSTAEAGDCPMIPVPEPSVRPGCENTMRPGVEFDFSAPGMAWYRLTALDTPLTASPALVPRAINSLLRVVHPDGSTTANSGDLPLTLAAFSTAGIDRVRVRLSSGSFDEMKAIDGWAAFATFVGPGSGGFGAVGDAQGLDGHGKVIATTTPQRCC